MERSITNPNRYVIIFWDDSKKFITSDENKQLERMMIDNIEIFELQGGGKYKFKDIKKWLPLEEYYSLYPNEKPVKYAETENAERIVYSKEQLIRALEQIIKGFKKHFENKKMPPQSEGVLRHMEKSLERAKGLKENAKVENPLDYLRQGDKDFLDFIHNKNI